MIPTQITLTRTSQPATIAVCFIIAAALANIGYAHPDVDQVNLKKRQYLLQTSAAEPTERIPGLSYQFEASVSDVSDTNTQILSATVTPQGGSATSLTGGGGNLFLYRNYANESTMNSAFPNGNYQFTLQTTTAPTTYTPALTLNTAFANKPTIINSFSSGALVIDPSQNYTFNWMAFSNFTIGTGVGARSAIVFQIAGTPVLDIFSTPSISSVIQAGTLQPNQTYTADLSFQNYFGGSDASTPFTSAHIATTRFTIQTVPEPNAAALLLIYGVFSFGRRFRKSRNA